MTLPEPFASYDPDSSCWKTCEDYLPLGLDDSLDEFSGRWPASGMTRSGMAYALPMSEHRTDGGASSSLLPTPTVQDGENDGGPSQFDRNTLPLNTVVKTL